LSEILFSSDVDVELVKCSAEDMDVIFSARVSTEGERTRDYTASFDETNELSKREQGLINFLMRERHGTPFEHSYFTFYVKAPIFVWREHMRHRIASYNEESGRYRELEPEFYVPNQDRKLVQVGKPGAYVFEEGTDQQYAITVNNYKKTCTEAYYNYKEMLSNGVAREVARGVLPVTIYSSAYVTMNARSLMNFLSLRRNVEGQSFPSYPQREIEMVAERYEEIFEYHMPVTHKAFVDNGRVSP
jgi:thymidylate synthase (FAD)